MKPKWNFFLILGSSVCQVFSSFFVTNSYWSIVALQCCVSLCSTEKISHPCVHIVVVESLSRVWLFAIPWIVARQAPLSMGFPRRENWSGFPFPAPGGLLDPGVEPISWHLLHGQAVSLPPSHQGRQYVYVYPFFPSHWSHHRSLSRVLYATQWILINGLFYTYWCWWWSSLWGVSNSCHPMDCSLPGSSVHGIFQARILEWVAISFSIYIQYHNVTCQSQSPNSSKWTLQKSSGTFSLCLGFRSTSPGLATKKLRRSSKFQFFGQLGLTQPSMKQTSYFWQNSLKHFLVSFQADVFQRFSRWVSFAVTSSEKPNCHPGLYTLKIVSCSLEPSVEVD